MNRLYDTSQFYSEQPQGEAGVQEAPCPNASFQDSRAHTACQNRVVAYLVHIVLQTRNVINQV